MGNGSGVARGDRNRNARLDRLRVLVPITNAIVGIDLADKKQMVVVTDHDSKVIARKTFRCRAWDLGVAVDWALERALAKGFVGVTVSCEPTDHRWRVLGQLVAERGMPFVGGEPAVDGGLYDTIAWYSPIATVTSAFGIAALYSDLGDKDQAFQWLNTAYRERDYWLIGLRTNFLFDPIRSDPRFGEMVHKVGLPQ